MIHPNGLTRTKRHLPSPELKVLAWPKEISTGGWNPLSAWEKNYRENLNWYYLFFVFLFFLWGGDGLFLIFNLVYFFLEGWFRLVSFVEAFQVYTWHVVLPGTL